MSPFRAATSNICESTHVMPGVRGRDRGHAGRDGSDSRCATTCAFRSCTGNSCRGAPSGWRCRRRSRCPRAARIGRRLLRARAIENLCYVVAPAQSGTHTSGRETYGDTLDRRLLGPGAVAPAKGDGVITAEIDLAKQAETRARFPALENRRLGLESGASGADMSAAPMFDVAERMILDAVGARRGPPVRPCSTP